MRFSGLGRSDFGTSSQGPREGAARRGRLVFERVATLGEIEEHYSLADIIRANHVLTLRQESQRQPEED
jgi:hypothetical protein